MAVAIVQGRQTMSGPMDEATYRPISRPPKAGAKASMSDDARDALEHRIHCQCGCTLDIYTCRTTDFTCPVSPQMHRDVMSLVAGGYTADEIIATFVETYGDKVLMAPPKQGFNWAGYIAPFAAIGAGALVLVAVLKHLHKPEAPVVVPAVDATSDELKRLEDAIRRDRHHTGTRRRGIRYRAARHRRPIVA
jgi:cytochrome c-type biogenesis protein CcmH